MRRAGGLAVEGYDGGVIQPENLNVTKGVGHEKKLIHDTDFLFFRYFFYPCYGFFY